MSNVNQLNSEKLYKDIDKLMSKDISLIDAIVEYCDIHDMEVELVGTILKKNSTVKTILTDAARNRNLLKK